MSDLKFDIEMLKNMKDRCDALAQDLDTTSSNLKESLEQLKKDWHTPAGEKFFKDLDDDWTEQVEHYKKIVSAVSSLLNAAINKYQNVENEANNLHFY